MAGLDPRLLQGLSWTSFQNLKGVYGHNGPKTLAGLRWASVENLRGASSLPAPKTLAGLKKKCQDPFVSL